MNRRSKLGRPTADPKRKKKRKYQREWWRSRKAHWLELLGPCACKANCPHHRGRRPCGEADPGKLEIDHIDPTTKRANVRWSWRLERILDELMLCQVLCVDCHIIKTENEKVPF